MDPSVIPPPRKKRRPHRKTHGMIGFRDLARKIGQRWKGLPPNQVTRYKGLAKIDMVRYQEDMMRFKGGGSLPM